MGSDIEVSEFELWLYFSVHFGINIPGKFMNCFILSSYG